MNTIIHILNPILSGLIFTSTKTFLTVDDSFSFATPVKNTEKNAFSLQKKKDEPVFESHCVNDAYNDPFIMFRKHFKLRCLSFGFVEVILIIKH